MTEPIPDAQPEDRRRHRRHDGHRSYLEVGGHPARLLDWSFSGIGAELDGGVADLTIGQSVDLRILRRDGVTWTVLSAEIRRIETDSSTVGTELTGDTDGTGAVLLELLGHKLLEAREPQAG